MFVFFLELRVVLQFYQFCIKKQWNKIKLKLKITIVSCEIDMIKYYNIRFDQNIIGMYYYNNSKYLYLF